MSSESLELRQAGLKSTLPRVKILQLLEKMNSQGEHLSAEDVYRYLVMDGENIGLPTVYRVLAQFESAGLVVRRQFIKGRSLYELSHDDHHDHMVCVDSNEVIEFRDPVIEQRQQEIAQQHNVDLVEHTLVLYVRKKP